MCRRIGEFNKRDYKVNAIITLSEEDANDIKENLSNKELINAKVLPFYMAKGLEFEGVIILDKSNYLKTNKNIYYVTATRAREALIIYN